MKRNPMAGITGQQLCKYALFPITFVGSNRVVVILEMPEREATHSTTKDRLGYDLCPKDYQPIGVL